MIGSYLGAASALVERVLASGKVSASERLSLLVPIESAMSAAENIARQMADSQNSRRLLVESLLVRYAVQDAMAVVTPKAVELLGGLSFISSDDVAYLAAVVHGLCFHPPARAKMAAPLLDYYAGNPLAIA